MSVTLLAPSTRLSTRLVFENECMLPLPRVNPQIKKYLKNFWLAADVSRTFGYSPLLTRDSGVWPGCGVGAVGGIRRLQWGNAGAVGW